MTPDSSPPGRPAGGSLTGPGRRLLRQALECLATGMETGAFLGAVCRLVVEGGWGTAAVIFLPEGGRLQAAAWAGNLPPVFLAASFSLQDDPEQPFSQAFQTGVMVRRSWAAADLTPLPWAAALREAHLGACLAVPLHVAGKQEGVLAVFAAEARPLEAVPEDLAEMLAGIVAAGVRLREQKEERPRPQEAAAARQDTLQTQGFPEEEEAGVGRFALRWPGFQMVEANDALARMLGWPDAQSFLREFVPAERVVEPEVWERLAGQAALGRVAEVKVRFHGRDGRVATLRLRCRLDAARQAVTGVAVDLTRLSELEEEVAGLRQSCRRLTEQYLGASLLFEAEQENLNRELTRERQVAEVALAACEAGVAAFRRDRRLTHWNRSLANLTGLMPREVLGKELDRVLPGLKAVLEAQGEVWPRPLPQLRHPVQLHSGMPPARYDATLTMVRDARGEPDGGVIVLRRCEEGSTIPPPPAPERGPDSPGPPAAPLPGEENARRRAARLEALGSLAGSLARDFEQILSVILGYTEMALAALPEEEPARARLAQVLKAGQRGRELVQQILSFSRPWEQRARIQEGPGGTAAGQPESFPPWSRGRGRVLLAAGAESQADLWGEILHSLGFEVQVARSGQEALELLRSRAGDLDLVIADQDLEPLSGLELARELSASHPGLPVILCLDPLDLVTLEQAKQAGVRDFLMKPWSLSELTAALNRVLPPPGPGGLTP